MQTNNTHNIYCYDVVYSPFDSQPFMLVIGHTETVTSRACCYVPRNSQAAIAFATSRRDLETPVIHSGVAARPLMFDLSCYGDETFGGTFMRMLIDECGVDGQRAVWRDAER